MTPAAGPPQCRLRVEGRRTGLVVWPEGQPSPPDTWFDPAALVDGGATVAGSAGRGSTLRFDVADRTLVLRHYCRGGQARRLLEDRYPRMGVRNSRPWRELALLTRLHAGAMPVPPPVGARIGPLGPWSPWYRGDLVTAYLPGTRTLTECLRAGPLDAALWFGIGATIARFHAVGVDHADLNAHNILIDPQEHVYLIDFDRSRLRWRGRWMSRNLARLRRSLKKVAANESAATCSDADWRRLLAGYHSRSG